MKSNAFNCIIWIVLFLVISRTWLINNTPKKKIEKRWSKYTSNLRIVNCFILTKWKKNVFGRIAVKTNRHGSIIYIFLLNVFFFSRRIAVCVFWRDRQTTVSTNAVPPKSTLSSSTTPCRILVKGICSGRRVQGSSNTCREFRRLQPCRIYIGRTGPRYAKLCKGSEHFSAISAGQPPPSAVRVPATDTRCRFRFQINYIRSTNRPYTN